MSKGGAIKPVVIVTDDDLRDNGGKYILGGRVAQPVEGFIPADIAPNENIEGGALTPVYIIGDIDLIENGGRYILGGGKPIKVVNPASLDRRIRGRVARAIYPINNWPLLAYDAKILTIAPSALKCYWPMNEASGTIAYNLLGDASLNGAYTSATPGAGPEFTNGDRTPGFDALNDTVDIPTAAFDAVFDGREFSISLWIHALAALYTNGANNRVMQITIGNTGGLLTITLPTAPTNTIAISYNVSPFSANFSIATSATNWANIVITCSLSNDRIIAYYGGTPIGEENSLLAWPVNPLTGVRFGGDVLNKNYFGDSICKVGLWDAELSQDDITEINNV